MAKSAAKKSATTRKRRKAAKKAATTRTRRKAAKKAAKTRKRPAPKPIEPQIGEGVFDTIS